LVDGKDDCMLRRIGVQADDVDELRLELRIIADLERLDPVWLQTVLAPNAADARLTHARSLGHAGAAPVRPAFGLALLRQSHDLGDALRRDAGFAPPSRRVPLDSSEPCARIAVPPSADRDAPHLQPR